MTSRPDSAAGVDDQDLDPNLFSDVSLRRVLETIGLKYNNNSDLQPLAKRRKIPEITDLDHVYGQLSRITKKSWDDVNVYDEYVEFFMFVSPPYSISVIWANKIPAAHIKDWMRRRSAGRSRLFLAFFVLLKRL